MKERSHERMIMTKPSFSFVDGIARANIKGKKPTIAVMTKLMDSGPNPSSKPSYMDISTDRNMNKALTSNALPTFLDMTLKFMSLRT